MARVKEGLTSVKGFINGMSHYTMEGRNFVKNSSAPDPERLATDPVYAKVRMNYRLFGSISNVVKPFRTVLQQTFGDAMKNRINGQLAALFRKMVMVFPDNVTFSLLHHKAFLQSIVFHDKRNFDQTAYMSFELRCDHDRRNMHLKLTPFQHSRKKGETARTHFRLTLAVLPFADHVRKVSQESIDFEPIENAWHAKLITADSGYMDVSGLKKSQTLTLEIPKAACTKHTSLVVLLHLSFYEQVNGTMYPFSSESVLKVAEVF